MEFIKSSSMSVITDCLRYSSTKFTQSVSTRTTTQPHNHTRHVHARRRGGVCLWMLNTRGRCLWRLLWARCTWRGLLGAAALLPRVPVSRRRVQ